MNISNELKQRKDNSKKEFEKNDVITEVKLLLDSDDAEDLRIANALGKNHSIAKSQKEVGQQIELEQLDGKYAGNVYKIEDIKKLCIKYRMRFLRSEYFAGYLDKEVFAKLKKFSKETNTEISDSNLRYNFFILAPDEAFNLKQTRLPRITEDPAIFYKIDDNHYRLIHKWGKDFTIARLWQGIIWHSVARRLLAHTIIAFLFCATLLYSVDAHSGSYVLALILSWGFGLLKNLKIYSISSSIRERLFTPYCWNKEERVY